MERGYVPLDISALKSSPALPGGGSTGEASSGAEAAATWAAAVGAWATGIIPASTTVAAAQATLQTTLSTSFSTLHTAAQMAQLATELEAAHLAFATTVGGGMAGYAPVPPAGQIGFAPIITADPPPESSQGAVDAIADALDAWMKTGISTLVAPPNTPVPWT